MLFSREVFLEKTLPLKAFEEVPFLDKDENSFLTKVIQDDWAESYLAWGVFWLYSVLHGEIHNSFNTVKGLSAWDVAKSERQTSISHNSVRWGLESP